MKKINKYLITFVLILSTITVTAQGKFDAHVQLSSMHYWRGLRVSDGPIIGTSVGYFSKGFSVYVWGGISFNGKYTEVTPVVNYSHKNFSATLLDIDNFSGLKTVNYFNYSQKNTNHIVDLTLAYKFSFFNFSWSTILYGNDRIAVTNQQKYSTYVEVGVPVKVNDITVTPFIAPAFALNSKAKTMLYGNKKFGIANVGIKINKAVTVEKYSLPISAVLGYNAVLNQASVQVSINLF